MTGFLNQRKKKACKKAPKSKDKHNKKASFRGHRSKFCEREALLCSIDFDPICSVVVRHKLTLDELLCNPSVIDMHSKVKVKKGTLKEVLDKGWEKEFRPNFGYKAMTEGKLDAKRALKWAQAVVKCSGLGFSFEEKMLKAAEFMKSAENFEDFVAQWKEFPTAKHGLSKDMWYGCNTAAEWKKEHVKPAVIKPWVELAKKSEKAQVEYFEKFMTDEEKGLMGASKPFTVAQSITNTYLNNDRECFPCKNCGVENWHSMQVVFDSVTNKNVYNKEQCGVICRECMTEALSKRDIDAEPERHVFHGLNTDPLPFRKCPMKGCTKGCVIQSFKACQYEYFAEKLCVEVTKLQNVFEKGAEEEVRRKIMEAKLHYDCSFVPNKEKPEDVSHKLNRTKINQIQTTINKISNNKVKQELRKEMNALNKIYYRYELSYWLYLLNTRIEKVVKARDDEKWDEMFTAIDSAQQAVNSTNSYISYAHNDKKLYGMTEQQLVRAALNGYKSEIKLGVSMVDRCGICMSTVPSKESDMLTLHTKEEYRPPSRIVPCKACPDCWDGFVNHTSALGKPQLKCCAAGCGRALNADHAKKIAPKSYAKYESALLKFDLKKVKNYKSCPNGHGFLTYENCDASRMTCPTCSINFCPGCGGQPHEDIGDGSCLDFLKHQHALRWTGKTVEDEKEKEDKKAEEKFFADVGESSKQCPYCNVWIEKNGGCQHMTCHSCRGEFCWLCNGQWKGHTSCETPIKICRPYFHKVFPKKVFEDEEPELWESDSEVNSECSDAYGNFLECFRTDWINPDDLPEKHNKDYGQDEYLQEVYYAQYLDGLRSDSEDSTDDYETDSECFVHDAATEIRYFNFIEGFACEDKWKRPQIAYANTYKNFLYGFKTHNSDSESDSDTDSLISEDFNTDTIPSYLFPIEYDSEFEFPPGQNLFPNSDSEDDSDLVTMLDANGNEILVNRPDLSDSDSESDQENSI